MKKFDVSVAQEWLRKSWQEVVRLDLWRRAKLSFAMLVGAAVALIRPNEIQQVLDDHVEANKRRRREMVAKALGAGSGSIDLDSMEADPDLGSSQEATVVLPGLKAVAGNNPRSAISLEAIRGLAPSLSAKELKAITLAANTEKRTEHANVQAGECQEISLDDAWYVVNALLVHLDMRAKRLASG